MFVLFLTSSAKGQDFLPETPQFNTFKIIHEQEQGTAFLIHHKGVNYYVTARHLFGAKVNKEQVVIDIQNNLKTKRIEGILLLHDNPEIDIAVIKPTNKETYKDAISLETIKVSLGDRGFFLGFPMGIHSIDLGGINNGFPIPLVKSAGLSGVQSINGVYRILLDGHNNPGFSGGPILFKNRFALSDTKYYLTGVITAYINQTDSIETPAGKIGYNGNSGIIVAFGAKHIFEIIGE